MIEEIDCYCLGCKQVVYDCEVCHTAPCMHYGFGRTLHHGINCGPVLYRQEAVAYLTKIGSEKWE